jgi:hypothetical protein
MDFEANAGNVWRDDPKLYQREVLSSVGLVCATGDKHVPAEIVEAVNLRESDWRRAYPQISCGPLVGGIFITDHCWDPAANIVLKYGDTLEHFSSKFEAEQFLSIHAADLPEEAYEENDACEMVREFNTVQSSGGYLLAEVGANHAVVEDLDLSETPSA